MRQLEQPWLKKHLLPSPHLHGPNECTQEDLLIGFTGFWIILDEAHIIAIAVTEPFRRQRIGQGLLLSAIEKAARMHARMVTLEVREKNLGAQSMYTKHGFYVAGRRPHYYTDTQEDAVLMTIDNIQGGDCKTRLAAMKAETLHNDSLAYPVVIPDDMWEARA
ncbi:MAG: ribosomal protein S18-alanine N-acetyltransferase [Dehalococcoidia bacterium]|nr:ribosomal protein S18-alanine N-acetyltransferase [Dehalococcoidia bacterium]